MEVVERTKIICAETHKRFISKCEQLGQDSIAMNSLIKMYKDTIVDLADCKSRYAEILNKYSQSQADKVKTFPGVEITQNVTFSGEEMKKDGEEMRELESLIEQLSRQSSITRDQLNGLAAKTASSVAAIELDSDQLEAILDQAIDTASNNGAYGTSSSYSNF